MKGKAENVIKTLLGILVGILVILVVMLATIFVYGNIIGFSAMQVSGTSMMPTLQDKEFALFQKADTIERFDIVVANLPDDEGKPNYYIKRVIGLPNDEIAIIDGTLYINGERYDEPYLVDGFIQSYKSERLYYKLGENDYFLMGDNRDGSMDSRAFGFITREQIERSMLQ